MISIAFSLLINTSAYGYATNFDYATTAKWSNNLNFMICIANGQGKEYEGLFLKAVDEWKSKWPHFAYTISYASGCHINVNIVKTHSMLADHGYVGFTTLEYWQHGAITKADIILPTHKKTTVTTEVKGKTVTEEYLTPLSSTLFYRAALHEFGHALNLGHFDDNSEEPIDIMHPYPASEDKEQGISQRDIQALNWYYLGYFGQEVTIRTDKKSYEPGDTVNVIGKVGKVSSAKVAVQVYDSSKKLYRSDAIGITASGTFNYKLKVADEMGGGSYKVKVSYDNIIVDASFDVKNTSETDETLIEVRNEELPLETEMTVTILDTRIVDHTGSEVKSIQPYEQVFIRSSLSSSLAERTEVTYIIQIKNSEGYTVQILSGTYDLAIGVSTFSLSWLPTEAERYDIEVFLWKSISDPIPLIPNQIDLKAVVSQ
jgi:hypothetical protein